MDAAIVKMSQKGQLVVPQGIREEEGLQEGDRFIPFAVKEGVLFKKVRIPDVKIEFESLTKEMRARFKEKGVTQKDVNEAVQWARKK
ncbi:AbrB/MazE/SpoVT family DNA-binding domain-containing protein [Candidatus Woesearchaeota archaeon]|nr:AbrB/MazE/SpoVT family DNA-binding domain-containing protein [Candidatus Woesearchaeota archaeon]